MDLTELSQVSAFKKKFWPNYFPHTAWLGHAPFAMWLVKNLKPKSMVELGSHFGYSYFAMCKAVKEAGLETTCFAVDTWQGDEHAGFYDQVVFNRVQRHNRRYSHFSRLLRMRFDQALAEVQDGSVDLLHIDGRHFYDDVKEDFESWIPKLSPRAVVLFHDTVVEGNGFGVKQYFAELTAQQDGFTFLHWNGLGVLFFGKDQTDFAARFRDSVKDEGGLAKMLSTFDWLQFRLERKQRLYPEFWITKDPEGKTTYLQALVEIARVLRILRRK